MLRLPLLAAALIATPATAEVKGSSSNAFEVEQRVQTVVPPAVLFRAFTQVAGWWDPEHTYSGDAANLSLTMTPGGCFCERLTGGGGVEHMRVAYADPGKQTAVLTGALGPLLYEAVNGVMAVKVEPIAGGSRLTLNYRASGFAKGGADKLAPLVDQVLATQVKRLRTYAAESNRRTERQ